MDISYKGRNTKHLKVVDEFKLLFSLASTLNVHFSCINYIVFHQRIILFVLFTGIFLKKYLKIFFKY